MAVGLLNILISQMILQEKLVCIIRIVRKNLYITTFVTLMCATDRDDLRRIHNVYQAMRDA